MDPEQLLIADSKTIEMMKSGMSTPEHPAALADSMLGMTFGDRGPDATFA